MGLPDLRAALTGLTSRGISFLTAGVVSLGCAVVLGQPDLVRIAGLLALLPVVVMIVMASYRLHLSVTRVTEPPRAAVGDDLEVRVEIVNRSGRRTPVLLFEDHLPAGLNALTRVVLPPLKPRESARVAYRVQATRRGRFAVGPARLLSVEPFGMAERTWQAANRDELLVRPRVHPLAVVIPVRRSGRGGDSDLGGAGIVGDADLSVREYRHGDDLRRVHWPTTARRGELMVRPDQHPQDHNAVVIIDSRANGQRGSEDDGTLEWLVSAAASVAVHAADLGQRVVLLGDGENPAPSSHDSAFRDSAEDDPVEEALDRLAVLRPTGPDSLAAAVETVARWTPSTVVALLGEVGPEDVEVLAGSAREAIRVALVCRSGGWEPLSASRRAALADSHDAAVARLLESGWRVAQVEVSEPLTQVWERLDHAGALA